MWFLALVFIAIPVVLVGWWLKLLYSNRNVPNPPSFGKPLCCAEESTSQKTFPSDWVEQMNNGYYD